MLVNLNSFTKLLKQVAFATCFLFSSLLYANPEIVSDNGVIVDGAKVKINEISDELYAKTGVSIIVYAKKSLNGQNIFEYEKNVTNNFKQPYVFILFAEQEKKVDVVIMPDELNKVVDKNYILNNRIIPILGAQGDKNSNESRYSAAILNGVAEVADKVSSSKGITLNSSLGSDTTTVMTIIQFVFYGIIILAVAVIIYRRIKK